MKKAFQDQIRAEDAWVVVLLRAEDEGQKRKYYYLAVRANRFEEFQEAEKSGDYFNPEDYGVVIASGEGEPDEETRAYINEAFGLEAQDEDAEEAING